MQFRTLLLLSLAAASPAQRRAIPPPPAPVAIATRSQITIDGPAIHNETWTLSHADGDWFITANDAHAALTLKSAAPGPPLTLEISWFGKQPTRVISSENNTDVAGDHVAFLLRLDGSEPYNMAARPGGDESLTVTVSRMDDHDLEARVTGTADKLRINASVSLHRDALPVRTMTGSYGTCENVVYDKLYGAQNRSPSDCELRFDTDVRRAIRQSLDRVVANFRTAGWLIEKEAGTKPITGMPRKTESQPFRIDFTNNGAYQVIAKLNPASPQYQSYRKMMEDAMQNSAEAAHAAEPSKIQANPRGPGGMEELQRIGYQIKGATEVEIGVSTNMPGAGASNFRGDHTMLNVPGAAYAVFVPYAQAATGGGVDNAQPRALILLGAWAPAAIEKHSDGGEQINIKPLFDKSAPTLSVQNIVIRMNGNQEMVQNILRQIDLAPLQALLRK